MHHLKDKYSKQLHLFYTSDEYKMGSSIADGASLKMKQDSESYGIKAR